LKHRDEGHVGGVETGASDQLDECGVARFGYITRASHRFDKCKEPGRCQVADRRTLMAEKRRGLHCRRYSGDIAPGAKGGIASRTVLLGAQAMTVERGRGRTRTWPC